MTVIGMQKGFGGVKWGIDDVSAVFLASALFSGIVGKLHPSEIANSFVKGAGGAVGGALVIGFARGVYWVMNSANINATIVYNATQLLKGLPPLAAAIGIVILVSFINGLIPSGSGKGALLAPSSFPSLWSWASPARPLFWPISSAMASPICSGSATAP